MPAGVVDGLITGSHPALTAPGRGPTSPTGRVPEQRPEPALGNDHIRIECVSASIAEEFVDHLAARGVDAAQAPASSTVVVPHRGSVEFITAVASAALVGCYAHPEKMIALVEQATGRTP